jgi:hypothetical protein
MTLGLDAKTCTLKANRRAARKKPAGVTGNDRATGIQSPDPPSRRSPRIKLDKSTLQRKALVALHHEAGFLFAATGEAGAA